MSGFDDSQLSREKLETALQELAPYSIPLERLKIKEEEIGKGGFGTVKLAELTSADNPSDTPISVAVKEIRYDMRVLPLRMAYRLVREMIVWSAIRHENILGFIGYHLSEDLATAYLVSPYAVNGSVKHHLVKAQATFEERLALVRDSVQGLEYLHSRNPPVLHGDLKSMNMLVTKERRGMLCDFGLANPQQDQPTGFSTSIGFKGTSRWCSPEVIAEGPKTLKSDVWSWGCLATSGKHLRSGYIVPRCRENPGSVPCRAEPSGDKLRQLRKPGFPDIMTGKIPYDDAEKDAQVIVQVVHLKTKPLPSQPPLRPESLHKLLEECWIFEPELRPDILTCKLKVDVMIGVERSLNAIIGTLPFIEGGWK